MAKNELRRFDEAVEACTSALVLDPAFTLARKNLRWAEAERAEARAAALTR